jgi:exodeoxyribonuclease VII small subunit
VPGLTPDNPCEDTDKIQFDMSDADSNSSDKSGPRDEEPDFESALEQLEALVARLEKGELSLEESLKQYETGVALTRRCQEILDKAQQRVEELGNLDDESSAKPIEPES